MKILCHILDFIHPIEAIEKFNDRCMCIKYIVNKTTIIFECVPCGRNINIRSIYFSALDKRNRINKTLKKIDMICRLEFYYRRRNIDVKISNDDMVNNSWIDGKF